MPPDGFAFIGCIILNPATTPSSQSGSRFSAHSPHFTSPHSRTIIHTHSIFSTASCALQPHQGLKGGCGLSFLPPATSPPQRTDQHVRPNENIGSDWLLVYRFSQRAV